MKGHASTLGHIIAIVVNNKTLPKRKGKNLVIEFDSSRAHDGLVGWECITFYIFRCVVTLFSMFQLDNNLLKWVVHSNVELRNEFI